MKYNFKTTKQRSRIMSKIRSNETTHEIEMRKRLWREGIRYRKNDKRFPGKPDITIKKHKVAIFIDGEFWHGYNWDKKKRKIKSNRKYWITKIEKNIKRDRANTKKLEKMGWKVFRFWQNEIKNNLDKCVKKVLKEIRKYEKV